MDKIKCIVCNRLLKSELSRKIKCGPKCLQILNEAKRIYQAKNKSYKKKAEIYGQMNIFKELEK